MIRTTIIILALVLLGAAGFFLLSSHNSTPPSTQHLTPSPSPTEIQTNSGPVLCETGQLTGSITTEPAAGNIYGSLVLTNTGSIPCTVTLGSSITATYQAKNITVERKPAPTPNEVTLHPGEKAYSQVHYPNGPQCSGPTTEKPVQFFYEVDGQTVSFINTTTKKNTVTVQACSAPADITTIDIWPLSAQPVTP